MDLNKRWVVNGAKIAILLFFGVVWKLSAASINDPTKPIYSENTNSSIVTTAVIKERKVVLLQSIFFGDKNKVAIINGEFLREGDVVDDVLMETIYKNYVMIQYKSNKLKVVLSKKLYLDKVTGEVSE